MGIAVADHGAMPGKPKIAPREDEEPPLYIGEWIRALGKRPSEVAKATGMSEGYLSSLINRRQRNPGRVIKKRIADFLKIKPHYFDSPPPDKRLLATADDIDAEVLARLAKNRR